MEAVAGEPVANRSLSTGFVAIRQRVASSGRRSETLPGLPMTRTDAWRTIRRCALAAGFTAPITALRIPKESRWQMRAIFVQIKCEMGQSYKVAREAADTIEQMSELYSTSGQYDLLGKFYLEPEQDIGLFITEKIQMLPGVKDTYTLITFNAFSGGRD
jgi:DNA-binding Lrp family transcriptional regulator